MQIKKCHLFPFLGTDGKLLLNELISWPLFQRTFASFYLACELDHLEACSALGTEVFPGVLLQAL